VLLLYYSFFGLMNCHQHRKNRTILYWNDMFLILFFVIKFKLSKIIEDNNNFRLSNISILTVTMG